MKRLRKNRFLCFLALFVLAPYAAGCFTTASGPEDGKEVVGERLFKITVLGADGTAYEQTGAFSELVGPMATKFSDGLWVDGQSAASPAALLTAHRTEFALVDGRTLVLEREGNTLRRVAPDFEADIGPAMSVEWNDSHDTLWVELPSGTGVVMVEGIEDPQLRARYLGILSVAALGGLAGEGTGPDPLVATGVVIVALAVLGLIGYLSCIVYGNSACADEAERLCYYGVDEYKVICGAGTDVNGTFHLGYLCSFTCQDPPPGGGGGGGPAIIKN